MMSSRVFNRYLGGLGGSCVFAGVLLVFTFLLTLGIPPVDAFAAKKPVLSVKAKSTVRTVTVSGSLRQPSGKAKGNLANKIVLQEKVEKPFSTFWVVRASRPIKAKAGKRQKVNLAWTVPGTSGSVKVRVAALRGKKILSATGTRTLTLKGSGSNQLSPTKVSDGGTVKVGLDGVVVEAPPGSIVKGETLSVTKQKSTGGFPDPDAGTITDGFFKLTTSQGQPTGPVKVTLAYDSSQLADGEAPVIVHGSEEFQAWMPENTVVDQPGEATATVNSFSLFSVVGQFGLALGEKVTWLAGNLTGNRNKAASGCKANSSSIGWIDDVYITNNLNDSLPACIGSESTDSRLYLHVTNNRGYMQTVKISNARLNVSSSWWSDSLESLVAKALANLGSTNTSVLIAPGSSAILAIDRTYPESDTRVELKSTPSMASAAAMLGWSLIKQVTPIYKGAGLGTPSDIIDCVVGIVNQTANGDYGTDAISRIKTCVDAAIDVALLGIKGGRAFSAANKLTGTVLVTSVGFKIIDLISDNLYPPNLRFDITGVPLSVNLTPISNRNSTVGDPVSIQVNANDSEGRILSFSATGLPSGISIDETTGLISGTISAYGVYRTQVTARNSVGQSRTTTFTWVVSSSGSPPEVNTETLVGTVNVPYRYVLPHVDESTQVWQRLDWALVSGELPPGITFGKEDCGFECIAGVFSGTPTTAGSWPLTMFAGGEQGSGIIEITLRVSDQPTTTVYTKTVKGDQGTRYRFIRSRAGDGSAQIVRLDTVTGEQVDVLATPGVPNVCKGKYPRDSDYQASSADGNQVGIGCSSSGFSTSSDPSASIYIVDLEDGTTERVDTPNSDAAQPVKYPGSGISSSTRIVENGVSADGTKVLFKSGQELTADAANEKNTVEHLYLRDLGTDQTSLIRTPATGSRKAVFREARLSRNGNYVTEIFKYCNGLNGGFCGGFTVSVHRSPFASAEGPCYPKCSRYQDDLLEFDSDFATSDDGLTVTYRADMRINNVWSVRAVVWKAESDTIGTLSDARQALLSGDGEKLFYIDQETLFTCRLVRRSVDSSAQFGLIVPLADPPGSLPRTGCSLPIASSYDGSSFVFGSTSTNLVPNPTFDDPENPTYYYTFYRGTG